MAAIAQSNPYAIFLRKIGYSVGLGHTLSRFDELEEVYLSYRDVSLSAWKNLVFSENHWKLKNDNIADFFNSLGLVHRTSGDVLVLENLDASAVATSLLDNSNESDESRSFMLLWAILQADGEIFVNSMLAGFDEYAMKAKFFNLLTYKRSVLLSRLSGRDSARKIARAINIERQQGNLGSAGQGQTVSSLKRTEPLEGRRKALNSKNDVDEIEISDDYVRKASQTRKNWAISLNLWDQEFGATALGHRFLSSLRSKRYITDEELFCFWPMEYEMVRAGFRPNLLPETRTLWQSLTDFSNAYAAIETKQQEASDQDVLYDTLLKMLDAYRSLHVRKSMLRREMAITIAYPCLVSMAVGKRALLIDVPTAIEAEQNSASRRITLRKSRNTGGALALRR